jgi:hypothetical protein
MAGSESKPPSPRRDSRSPAVASPDRASLKKELVELGRSPRARQALGGSGTFAIALDATGSMQGLIDDAKRSIEAITNRVFKEAAARVKMQLFIYRDYDVGSDVLSKSRLSENSQELVRWLASVKAFGGGANPGEAINEALQAIHSASCFDAVILAGDEPSLSRKYLDSIGKQQHRSAIELAAEMNVPIYTFVVGSMPSTIEDFRAIAAKSGGTSGRLDGSDEMINMAVMAILARLKGSASVGEYMKRHQLTHNSREFGKLLLTPPRK